MNSWIVLIIGVFAFVGSCLFILSFLDWCYAVIYEWRKRRAGRRSASPSPSGSPVLIITTFRVTPDRPTDPFLEQAKAEINKLTEGA